jgi:hypothetical protein
MNIIRHYLMVMTRVAFSAGALMLLASCIVVQQQNPSQDPSASGPVSPSDPSDAAATSHSDSELQQLVSPIAMDPDPILADVLPASTYPEQVQEADQWLQNNPNPTDAQIAAQPWDPSVKTLVHYPDALAQLDKDPDWTQSLGSAYANEPGDVMAAVQDLRSQAKNVGSLASNDQVTVADDGQSTAIIPTDPSAVSVPTYDPNVVYVSATPIVWGTPYPAGIWLNYGLDWSGGFIFVGNTWHDGWYRDNYGWRRNPYFRPRYAWMRNNARWGPPPRPMYRYAIHSGVRPAAFPTVRRSLGGQHVRTYGQYHSPIYRTPRPTVSQNPGSYPLTYGTVPPRQPIRNNHPAVQTKPPPPPPPKAPVKK